MAISWLDTPYGTLPEMSATNVGGYASAPLSWDMLPQLAAQLGYQVQLPNMDSLGAANDTAVTAANQNSVDAAAKWLAAQGYTPKVGSEGSTYYNGIFDKSGNLVAKQGVDSSQTSMGDLTGLLKWVGLPALAGGLLSGALGAAPEAALPAKLTAEDMALGQFPNGMSLLEVGQNAAPAVGNGAFVGEGALSGIPAWDAAAVNAGAGWFTPATLTAEDMGLGNTVMSYPDMATPLAPPITPSISTSPGGPAAAPPSSTSTPPVVPNPADAGTGLLSWLKDNPELGKLLFAGAGSLLSGLGGSSGSGAPPYSGPMPTISRGGWSPSVAAVSGKSPGLLGGLSLGKLPAAGYDQSGLWRFLSGG